MADLINVRFEGDGKGIVEGRLDDIFDIAKAKRLIKDAIDDSADAIEVESSRQAPVETGALKLHPVDREDTRFGIAEAAAFSFGGGISARGERGRFVAGGLPEASAGQIFARSTISVAKEPKYAIWVHDGTGVYGPRKSPITAKVP